MLFIRNPASYGLLFLAASLLLIPMAVFGQATPGEAISINNAYIGVSLYRSGDADSGIHTMWNVAGDPSTPTDDNKPVLFFGAVQILSDILTGQPPASVLSWATFDKGGNLGLWGDLESDGYWSVLPTVLPGQNCIRGVWRPTPTETDFPLLIDCAEEIRLFHDVAQFKWTLTNNDLYDHQIGLKFWSDVIVEPSCTGVLNGDNVVSVPGYPLIENRTLFPGKFAPDVRACPSIEFFNSLTDPGQGVRAVFDASGATRPDVIGIDEYATLRSTAWSYISDPLNMTAKPKVVWGYDPPDGIISTDVCYAAFWKPITLRPGQKRTIVHYIGNPASNISAILPSIEQPRYAAAVTGPKILKYYMDPTSGDETFGPSTFNITAYLENQDRFTDLQNGSFTLVLPTGLSLDPSETQYTKTIARITPGTEGSVSWKVIADGARTGILSYYVSVNAYPMGGNIVKRDIHVPAISKQPFYYGWQQVSVPFDLVDTNPATALGLDLGSLIKMFRYDPTLPQTAPYYPYEEVLSLKPGEAYWMKLSRPDSAEIPTGNFSPIQWDGFSSYLIDVHSGWNMIGNPYVYTVTAGELRFYTESLGSISYDEAIAQKMISRTVYWWNTSFNTWNWSNQRTVQIKPWQGYWIKIIDPRITQVMITPASQIGANIGGAPPPIDDGGDGGGPPTP